MKIKKTSEAHEIENKLDELTGDLKRVQAEFENFKKRTEKESRKSCEAGKSELVKKLLPIVDAFESALKTEKSKGMELIYSQFMKALAAEGLSEINTKGKFDPSFHEAMLQQHSNDLGDDEIVEVIQKGYRIGDCIIRTAKVKINVRSEEFLSEESESKSENKSNDRLDKKPENKNK